MNCEQFFEHPTAQGGDFQDLRWQMHCRECPACAELLDIAQRLERESPATDSASHIKPSELANRIQHAALVRRQRTQRTVAIAGCLVIVSAVVLSRGLFNQHQPKPSADPRNADLAHVDSDAVAQNGEHPSETAIAKTELPGQNVDGISRPARKGIMRLLDKTGKVHEVPVLVVSAPQRKISFGDLSPLERQLVRRYLELQGHRNNVISL